MIVLVVTEQQFVVIVSGFMSVEADGTTHHCPITGETCRCGEAPGGNKCPHEPCLTHVFADLGIKLSLAKDLVAAEMKEKALSLFGAN